MVQPRKNMRKLIKDLNKWREITLHGLDLMQKSIIFPMGFLCRNYKNDWKIQ